MNHIEHVSCADCNASMEWHGPLQIVMRCGDCEVAHQTARAETAEREAAALLERCIRAEAELVRIRSLVDTIYDHARDVLFPDPRRPTSPSREGSDG